MAPTANRRTGKDDVVRIFLAGDVLTGGAIDHLFATHNSDDFGKPGHKPAAQYLNESEQLHGAVQLPVAHDYIWGVALGALEAARPDFRLANLETPVTTCSTWEPKSYSFRMHPDNIGCLTALGLDCVSLANNHCLDFGIDGMIETCATLRNAGIGYCGAGMNLAEAAGPHVQELPGGKRILVFSWGFRDSHIGFPHWAAGAGTPGINYVETVNEDAARQMAEVINAHRRPDDIVIASLHWGPNWVRRITAEHRMLSRFLIDNAGVDLIHGHSAHHVLPVESHRGKMILYGCGDLIDDFEGEANCRALKGHLGALYFVDIDARTHWTTGFTALPVERRRFRLEVPSRDDAAWLHARIGQNLAATG